MKNYKKHEFTPSELSDKAFDVYSNSTFTFYKYNDSEIYLMSDCGEKPTEIGTLADVDEYLESYAQIEE